MNGITAANQIFKILDEPLPSHGDQSCDFSHTEIQLKNVNFSYVPDRQILHNINITIPENSFVSIVGESGCGKSTIASLLMGFNSYTQGSITLNHQEINSINPVEWARHVCIVKHKNYLFKGSIADNLQMGKNNATKAEMDQVLKAVNLYDFVYENRGLDFTLTEGGKNLSGGQAQRLALARAILHDAKIYIFDEASSNIDLESEKMILQAINQLRAHKTVILISHRLVNVVESDVIYVLDKGRIVEQGTHTELM